MLNEKSSKRRKGELAGNGMDTELTEADHVIKNDDLAEGGRAFARLGGVFTPIFEIVDKGLEWETACQEWDNCQVALLTCLTVGPSESDEDSDTSDSDSESGSEPSSDKGVNGKEATAGGYADAGTEPHTTLRDVSNMSNANHSEEDDSEATDLSPRNLSRYTDEYVLII